MNPKKNNKKGSNTNDAKTPNAGSGAFNQGSAQDPDYDKGVPVSDEEKRTGNPPTPIEKERKNPGKTNKS